MDQNSSRVPERPTNPYENAGRTSRLTFWWLISLFRTGLQRPFDQKDVYECLPEHRSHKLSTFFENAWNEERLKSPEKPRLLWVILRIYAKKFLWLGLFHNTLDISIKILQTHCLGGLVVYFSPGEHNLTINDARLYAATIFLGNVLVAVCFHGKMTYCMQIEMRIRLTLVSAIYKKMLRLTKSMSVDGLNGQVINLMSNDINRVNMCVGFFHVLSKGPAMLLVMGYMIYLEIGWYGFVGIGMLVMLIPLLVWVGKKSAQLHARIAGQKGRRIRVMNEILQAIQMIKMYTWEKPFVEVVDKLRKKELKTIRSTMFIRMVGLMSRVFANISIFLSLVAYVYFGNAFSARKVYTVTAYMNFLFTWMVYYWSFTIMCTSEVLVSMRRIEEFLLLPETKAEMESMPSQISSRKRNGPKTEHNRQEVVALMDNNHIHNQKHNNPPHVTISSRRTVNKSNETNKPQIKFLNASASWVQEGKGGSNAVTDLNLEVHTGELCAIIGMVGSGKSTLLQVLLGELELDAGSLEIAGTMSYAPQEPWLFGGSVRQNVVFVEPFDEERYWEVVRVCALERDFELLPFGDQTIVGERGSSLSGGQRARISLARAIYKKADIYLLDDPLSAVDSSVGKHIFEKCIAEYLKDKLCILVTHQLQYLNSVDKLVLMSAGQINAQGNFAELRENNDHPLLSGFVSEETNSQEQEEAEQMSEVVKKGAAALGDQSANKEKPTVDLKGHRLYLPFLSAVNNIGFIALVVALLFISQVFVALMDVYISKWSTWEDQIRIDRDLASNSKRTNYTSNFEQDVLDQRLQHVLIYVSGTLFVLVLIVLRNLSVFEMCLMAARHLHDRMFRGITRAWMGFFNANPSGRILNRFSQDINTIDQVLPFAIFEFLTFGVELLAMLYIITRWSLWLMIPNALLLLVFIQLRRTFIATARHFKNFDSISRSPIFAHTNATLQGLTTIRAFNAEKTVSAEMDALQDYNTSAGYTFLTTTRAFALWVELACCLYIGVILCFYLTVGSDTTGSQIGLAISQMLSLATVSQLMLRQQTEMETQMISVQRVDEYAHIEAEPALESDAKHKPDHEWPSDGSIKFKHFHMSYTKSGPDVLIDINLEILPQEKIGIVGRTGAGKSSIVQAIFRLANNRGHINIDGIETSTLGLHDLRSKISIIPQEPVLFSGSMRHNLDPFSEVNDEAIWKALSSVELKDVVASMPGGLDGRLTDGGSNFSLGQRQLVCLARAILRQNRILILDEATASVDAETDRLIQKSIRDQFGHCTVMTVAHRLHTVMDSDRVLVMDAGRAVEFDHPAVLLQNADGYFSELVRQTGSETEKVLRQLVEQSFISNKKIATEES